MTFSPFPLSSGCIDSQDASRLDYAGPLPERVSGTSGTKAQQKGSPSSGGNNKAFVQKVNARGSLSVAETCNSFQYWVDNAKGMHHTPTEWEGELQEDLTAHQWGPKFMTADSREISSTPLFVLLAARIPSLSCKACLKLIWPQSCNPPKPNMQGVSCRWRIIQALRPDGAPSPRKQN